MTAPPPYVVAIDASNPGEFLAVCGLIELVGHCDRFATSTWSRRSGFVPEVKSAYCDVCEIQTSIAEDDFIGQLAGSMRSPASWQAVTQHGRVPLKDAIGKWVAGIELTLESKSVVVIDHWYERAFVQNNEIVQKVGKSRDGKGRWKFWAGHHDGIGIAGLLIDYVEALAGQPDHKTIHDLLGRFSVGGSSFKIDANATRSALDRGISANDAAKEAGSQFRPAVELLALVGLSTCFPPRRIGDAAPDGSCGIRGRRFCYATWSTPAALSISRLLARAVDIPGFPISLKEAPLGMMGQYTFLRSARPTGVATANRKLENLDHEDNDDNDE